MKNILLIPLRYVFSMLVIAICICGYVMLTSAARSVGIMETGTRLYINIVTELKLGVLWGGIFSTLLLLRSALMMTRRRHITLLLLFLFSLPSFFFGYYALHQVELQQLSSVSEISGYSVPLEEDYILTFAGGGLYTSNIGTETLESVRLYHYGNLVPNLFDISKTDYQLLYLDSDLPRMSFIDRVSFSPGDEELIIPADLIHADDDLRIPVISITNRRDSLLTRPAVGMLNLFENVVQKLDSYAETISLPYALLITALFFFIFSTILFLRLTRWPLINFIIAIIVNIGGLLIIPVLEISIVDTFLSNFLSDQFLYYVPSILLTVFSIIFTIIHAILPSVNDWLREII